MKKNNACAYYTLLNEYFIESIENLSSHVTDLFNTIFESGFFPKEWSNGTLVPVYNYRGMTKMTLITIVV